jgi:hypothetical protein
MDAVVERNDRSAAQEHSAKALFGFLGIPRRRDDRAQPAGADHRDDVD